MILENMRLLNVSNTSNTTKLDLSPYVWWLPIQTVQSWIGFFGLCVLYYVVLFGNKKKFRKVMLYI